MRKRAIVIAMLAATTTADAAEINAFISTALKTVTDEASAPFERAGGSIGGPHIQKIFAQLGSAEQMAPKSKLSAGGPNGRVSVLVAGGEAEIGLQQGAGLLLNPHGGGVGRLAG